MLHRVLPLALLLSLAACVTESAPTSGRASAPPAVELDDALAAEIAAAPGADACVADGCPHGLSCDWVRGCVADVMFCCADEQCGAGRHCDFAGGGVCRGD